MLQHVVALSSLQLGQHLANELARAGLRKPWEIAHRPGSWFRGFAYLLQSIIMHCLSLFLSPLPSLSLSVPLCLSCVSVLHTYCRSRYTQLVSATAAHESAATAAVRLEKQVGSFASPGEGSLDTEQWASASLAKAQGQGNTLSGLAAAMAKAEAVAATTSNAPPASFAAVFGVLTVAVWVTMLLTSMGSDAKFWALSIALSPAGAALRYTLGLYNGRGPWGADFPWGTAAANILGSGLSCLFCAHSPRCMLFCAHA